MNAEKQKLLIEYLISSPDTFAICQSILKADYFDPEYKNTIRFIQTYYEKYSSTPTPDQLYAETGQKFKKRTIITQDEVEYCCDEVEVFCKRKGLEKAILKAAKQINEGNYGSIVEDMTEAVMISLHDDLGVAYHDTVQERLERMLNSNPTEPTGWAELDEYLFGGISRKELFLCSANSGGGKSITLANLALNFIERGRDVLYLSLELAEDIIAQRFDTMITGISRRDWQSHVSEIVSKVETHKLSTGLLTIKQLPSGTTANEIRSYLKEYYLQHKKYPDLLVLDYLDEMAPNDKRSSDNIWQKDKDCTTQLRQIGVDYNMFIATASQLNREAVKANQHDHSHIAGGISKINVSDVYISIKLTDTLKAQGKIMFTLQKTRNSDGVGKNVFLKWDAKFLRIRDDDSKPDLKLIKKDKASQLDATLSATPTGEGLADMMSKFAD